MAADLTEAGPTTWMVEGACRTHDPELFFPISATDAGADQVHRAVSVCDGCGVETECLRYALTNNIKHGIWGGHTEQERLATLRRSRTHYSDLRRDH